DSYVCVDQGGNVVRSILRRYAIHTASSGALQTLSLHDALPISYDVLQEMDEVNPKFKTTDVVLVVGANDVVNPAAKTSPGSPIYGMPILEVSSAKQVVFLKRSMRPGFAGIDNELLFEPTTALLFG